jgi:hypothetical protein
VIRSHNPRQWYQTIAAIKGAHPRRPNAQAHASISAASEGRSRGAIAADNAITTDAAMRLRNLMGLVIHCYFTPLFLTPVRRLPEPISDASGHRRK